MAFFHRLSDLIAGRPRPTSPVLAVVFGIALAGFVGCGKKGISRYEVMGDVTYDGRPLPVGTLVFTPDASQGNRGPGAHGDIVDGKYRLATVGGPHDVSIQGYDGNATVEDGVNYKYGKPLFLEFTVKVDLPSENATQDFDIPATNGKGK